VPAPAAPVDGLTPRPAGFNLDAALERVDGDVELLRELARLFLDECPQRIDEIRRAMTGRDAEGLQQAAHTLKGSVGNFAVPGVFEAARRLEDGAHARDWPRAEEAWATLEDALGRLNSVLAGLAQADAS
jgi:HPt (histidine-containing phosphotransfer) domain-containing protein